MDERREKIKKICEENEFPFPEISVLMGVGGYLAEQPDLESLELAETAFNMILEMEPGNADAMHNLGVTMMRQGRSGDAVPVLRKALALSPEDTGSLVALGAALSNTDEYPDALIYLEKAAEISPGSAKVLMNLATCLLRAGEYDAAEKALKDLLESDPLNVDAAEALEILKRQRKAWDMVKKVRSRLDEGDSPEPEEIEAAFMASLSLGRRDLSVYFLELLGGEIRLPATGSVYSLDGRGGIKVEAIRPEIQPD
ncbi:MAG: tetratricopeptide repeat protein [Chloroflexi bacterium]|nr:tetratricopeptide repeat protein [Chloroflexota bacterium]